MRSTALILYCITTKEMMYTFMMNCTGLCVTSASGRDFWILYFWKNQIAIREP